MISRNQFRESHLNRRPWFRSLIKCCVWVSALQIFFCLEAVGNFVRFLMRRFCLKVWVREIAFVSNFCRQTILRLINDVANNKPQNEPSNFKRNARRRRVINYSSFSVLQSKIFILNRTDCDRLVRFSNSIVRLNIKTSQNQSWLSAHCNYCRSNRWLLAVSKRASNRKMKLLWDIWQWLFKDWSIPQQ